VAVLLRRPIATIAFGCLAGDRFRLPLLGRRKATVLLLSRTFLLHVLLFKDSLLSLLNLYLLRQPLCSTLHELRIPNPQLRQPDNTADGSRTIQQTAAGASARFSHPNTPE
jgi:hypothetical protein